MSLRKEEKFILYHGSDVVVTKPKVDVGRKNIDFGQGFYLTSYWHQAKQWSYNKTKRNHYQGHPIVSKYDFSKKNLKKLKCKSFSFPSKEWLDLVSSCRILHKVPINYQQYDIIRGPLVDGAFQWYTLDDYINGKLNYMEAIQELEPENLKDQWVVRTQVALKYLNFRGVQNEKPRN